MNKRLQKEQKKIEKYLKEDCKGIENTTNFDMMIIVAHYYYKIGRSNEVNILEQ